MTIYRITNEKTKESYKKPFNNFSEVSQWVENTLDLSLNWNISVWQDDQIQTRLDYLRQEILAERISYQELTELQSLADYIPDGDTLLLEWAGVPEFED